MYRYIEPEIAGGLGRQTVIHGHSHPPDVAILHYEFKGWLGDELLETFPCFIMSEALKSKVQSSGLTGVFFEDVIVTISAEFYSSKNPDDLPKFYRAKINGEINTDDFFIAQDLRLVISEKAFDILKMSFINHALTEQYF